MKPILVVGTGRSGTSTVAKALIDLGVNMGERFRPEDSNNPGGVWEDLDFNELHYKVFHKQLSLTSWKQEVKKVIAIREGLWGFKDPSATHFLPEYIELLQPRFVWARRDIEESIDSCVRCYNMDRQFASVLMHFRQAMCEKYLKGQPTLEVWCGKLDINKLEDFIMPKGGKPYPKGVKVTKPKKAKKKKKGKK